MKYRGKEYERWIKIRLYKNFKMFEVEFFGEKILKCLNGNTSLKSQKMNKLAYHIQKYNFYLKILK